MPDILSGRVQYTENVQQMSGINGGIHSDHGYVKQNQNLWERLCRLFGQEICICNLTIWQNNAKYMPKVKIEYKRFIADS